MSRSSSALAVLLTVVAVAACAVSVVGLRRAPGPDPHVALVETSAAVAPAPPHPAAVPSSVPPSVELLRAWDARRSAAWARGDLRLLATLYTPGSVAGRHDRSMLRAWTARGLVVRGLSTQLLAVQELSRSPARWTLRVTDRLAGGVAVGPGVRRSLPVDSATTRTIELRRLHGRWRVASVT